MALARGANVVVACAEIVSSLRSLASCWPAQSVTQRRQRRKLLQVYKYSWVCHAQCPMPCVGCLSMPVGSLPHGAGRQLQEGIRRWHTCVCRGVSAALWCLCQGAQSSVCIYLTGWFCMLVALYHCIFELLIMYTLQSTGVEVSSVMHQCTQSTQQTA